jgi:hypothetical protein
MEKDLENMQFLAKNQEAQAVFVWKIAFLQYYHEKTIKIS